MRKLLKLLKKAKKEKRFVFICGNGGSAATAEHFSNDLFSKGIKAICLNSNMSIITMIANDFGYEYIFSKQLDLFGNEGDLLITLSASGTSPNVVTAIVKAKLLNMDVYEFEHARKKKRINYEKLEDNHMLLVHKIKKAL